MPSSPKIPPPIATARAPTVLVTGAAKRLGRDIALALAAAGWRVAVHYRDSVEDARRTVAQCSALTPGAASFRSNLGNETAVRNLLPTVVAEFGQVDAVVNCASTFEQDTPATFSFEAMEKHMRSNAGAAILLSQALHTHIGKRRASEPLLTGVVVNLLDQKIWNKAPDLVSYTLSKAALDAANTLLAVALQPLVRVVGVAPEVAARGPLLKGEKLAERQPEHSDTNTPIPDATAAVLLALQDSSLTATTLLVEDGPPAAQSVATAASHKGSNV